MKLTYNDITIDFFERGDPNQVLLSLSGGLDSAALFYLICKHFSNTTIIPYTAKDILAPFDSECAGDITDFMQEIFPHVNILDREVFEFDRNAPLALQIAKEKMEEEKVIVNGKNIPRATLKGLSKILLKRQGEKKLKEKYPNAIVTTGQSLNPPVEVMKEMGFYELAERRRDLDENSKRIWGITYQPFINVDKKFIADIYKKENLIDSLFPLTNSCIGHAKVTDFFTKECRNCFWCYEKKWAFDLKWL